MREDEGEIVRAGKREAYAGPMMVRKRKAAWTPFLDGFEAFAFNS